MIPIFYLDPEGDDRQDGRSPVVSGGHGPCLSLPAVVSAVRRAGVTEARIELGGGVYPMREPLLLLPDDPGHLTFAAAVGAEPVLDGGCRLEADGMTRLNGRAVCVFRIPERIAVRGVVDQLFVNGQRKRRCVLPKQGSYRLHEPAENMEHDYQCGADRFGVDPADFDPCWHDLAGMEAVLLHWWTEERMPVSGYDVAAGKLISSRESVYGMWPQKSEYRLYNVREALTEPGEYYVDRHQRRLYYLPEAGEDAERLEAVVPSLGCFVLICGDPGRGRLLEEIHFEGISFRHGGAGDPAVSRCFDLGGGAMPELENAVPVRVSPAGAKPAAAAQQSAVHLPGLLMFHGARRCSLRNCRIGHSGWYGVAVNAGCSDIVVSGCEIHDLGGGGVRAGGGDGSAPEQVSHHLTLTDNHIHHCGQLHHSAVGIGLFHWRGALIEHNRVHDCYYTGISCGWVWGYGASVSGEIRIGHNHIYNIGQGLLSDLGGVYLLGVQPGTRIYNNRIHAVTASNYGSTAIYLDEGSAHVVVENNLAYDCDRHVFSMHYGRENMVRGNVFAFGGTHTIAFYDHSNARGYAFPGANKSSSLTLLYNVVISAGDSCFFLIPQAVRMGGGLFSDCNWLYRADAADNLEPFGQTVSVNGAYVDFQAPINAEAWQAAGRDRGSTWAADPGFTDLAARDFSLRADSPLRGDPRFAGFDPTTVGPRPLAARAAERPETAEKR